MRRPLILTMFFLILAAAALAQPGPPRGGFGPGPLGLGPSPAIGGPAGAGPAGPPPGGGDRIAQYLGLSDAQKAVWEAAHTEFRTATEPFATRQRDIQKQLHTSLESGSTDACAVGGLMLQIRSLGDQIRSAHAALDAKLESVLTAEQKAKYESFRAALAVVRPGPPHD